MCIRDSNRCFTLQRQKQEMRKNGHLWNDTVSLTLITSTFSGPILKCHYIGLFSVSMLVIILLQIN